MREQTMRCLDCGEALSDSVTFPGGVCCKKCIAGIIRPQKKDMEEEQ